MNLRLGKNRLEAFSDGVIAIIITIMILELKIPELHKNFTDKEVWVALLQIVPKLSAYILSFLVIAIMWLNHHSLFERLSHSDSKLVWYNSFLLFSMSLIPLPTAFLAEHLLLYQAVMLYGLVMFLSSFSFYLLRRYVEVDAKLIPYNKFVQRSNIITTLLYFFSIPLSLVSVYFSYVIFIGIPIWYFLPDKFHQN